MCCYIYYKNLLHFSTPPGQLQGEHFLYAMAALILLRETVPLASHSVRKETVLPEDDPEGLKHVRSFYSEDNILFMH
jgi:hypothetical protein